MNEELDTTQPTTRPQAPPPVGVETIEPTIEPMIEQASSHVDDAPTVPTRRRARWYHVAVLGVAVLACAAGVGFSMSQSSDRDDAQSKRDATRAALVSQRADTQRARVKLASDRADAKATLADIDTLTTSLKELTDLTSQYVDALASVNQAAISSPNDPGPVNAQLARAGTLVDQLQARALRLVDQANKLRDRADAQFAAFRPGARASGGRTAPT